MVNQTRTGSHTVMSTLYCHSPLLKIVPPFYTGEKYILLWLGKGKIFQPAPVLLEFVLINFEWPEAW